MRGGFRDGRGTMRWIDGAYYEGDWKEGYACGQGAFYYVNGEQTLNYEENLTFTQFQGAQLLDPYSGNAAVIKLPPQQDEMVLVKLSAAWGLGYSMGMKLYE